MVNGPETHEWRIKALEDRMEKVESKIISAMYILMANLVGIIMILIKILFIK